MTARRDDPSTWPMAVALLPLAVALAAFGALSLGSGDFAFQWQPVPPDVPARATLAMAAGALELAAAALLVPARLRAVGAWLAAAILLGWVALHLPSVASRPTSIADWLGVAESSAMASATLMFAATWAGVAAAGTIRRIGFVVFGLSALLFGISHFVYADFTASMIPTWLPQRVALVVSSARHGDTSRGAGRRRGGRR